MAKTSSSVLATPGMSSKQKPAPPKSGGKQTTLLGFFTKKVPVSTPSREEKRVEARAAVPLTPAPSSDVGEESSPVRMPRDKNVASVGGLRTPETPVVDKGQVVALQTTDSGARRRRRVNYADNSGDEDEEEHISKKRPKSTKRKVVVDDDDSDVFVPMDIDEPEDDDLGSLSAEDEDPAASLTTTIHSTPEPIPRKPAKSKLSKFTATPASSSPASTSVSTPRPALGAFGQPLDKTERLKTFTEKNKDRYSWLLDVRDKDRNRPGDENYDPRSLYIPPTAWKAFTAFEKQYWEVKQNLWDTVLFFQKGKFFELYENDATTGHQKFDLKLTDRTNMRMVGVPESHFEYWAAQFVAQGYKVAKASQAENKVSMEMRQKTQSAAQNKKEDIIRRELTCVLTSGTLVDETMLHDQLATYCIAVKELAPSEVADPQFGIAYVDASTGEMGICEFKDDVDRTKLETLLARLRPKEVLLERGNLTKLSQRMLRNCLPAGALWNWLSPEKEFWDEDRTESELLSANYFSRDSEEGDVASWPEALKTAKESRPLALSAYGALVFYLRYLKIDTDIVTMGNVTFYDPLKKAGRMVLDGKTLINLEIFENSWDKSVEGTVFRLLWRGVTPFGKRLFRQWLCHPLYMAREINARLDAADTLSTNPDIRDHFLATFNRLPDLERILSRIHAGRCKVKDFVRVLEAFDAIQSAISTLSTDPEMSPHLTKSKLLASLLAAFDPLRSLLDGWEHAFDWEKAKDEDLLIPAPGIEEDFDVSNARLDALLADLESLRKGYQQKHKSNKIVFKDLGKEIFQIECPVGIPVPSNWRLLSSTKAVKRYWSPEVERKVRELLEARETHRGVVGEMKARLYARFDADYGAWMGVVRAVAHLDCLVGLSVFNEGGLGEPKCRPEFVEVEGGRAFVEFEELRHPCVLEGIKQDFIPNDVSLGGKVPNLVLLTGANMAGKSTLLRQTCVAVIMAQVGCYVPARRAVMTPVDRIMSRLGANDNIFASASTFMVELAETKKILSEATPNSLVILDELGRGTSTYDGVAVAHAVLHHLASHVGCIGFFATHYRNLGEEFKSHPEIGMKTMSVLVDEEMREVTFLYKLIDGISEKSYGMNVAAMAGVPHEVVEKAEEAAREFELGSKLARSLEKAGRDAQVSLALQSDFAWLGRLTGKTDDEDVWDVTRRLQTLLRIVDVMDRGD